MISGASQAVKNRRVHTKVTRQRDMEKRQARRLKWLSDNAPCPCGSIENLECHHVDPTTKVSHRIWSWGEARRIEELKKCVVVCNDCHKKISSARCQQLFQKEIPHGSVNGYLRHACRCAKCKAFYRKWRREKYLRLGK